MTHNATHEVSLIPKSVTLWFYNHFNPQNSLTVTRSFMKRRPVVNHNDESYNYWIPFTWENPGNAQDIRSYL